MKNITITLDEQTAAWARVHAAKQNMSVSRMIGERLQKQMRQSQRYEPSMHRYLAKPPVVLKRKGKTYPTREKVHERSVFVDTNVFVYARDASEALKQA